MLQNIDKILRAPIVITTILLISFLEIIIKKR